MDVQAFIEKFAEAVEVENVSAITPETKFRELEEWSSLAGLSVIAMFDDEYDTELTIPEFKKAVTIGDLYKLLSK